MHKIRFKTVDFSNRKREIYLTYSSRKEVTVHFGTLGIKKKIASAHIDKETGGRSVVLEFTDGAIDYLPYDQPLHIVKDPDYLLQEHVELVVAQITNTMHKKRISKKYLARQLKTSDNQIQRLLDPSIPNKNLSQLYRLASLVGLEAKLHLLAG